MSGAACPDVGSLQALLQTTGGSGEPDEVVRHLETCAACQRTLEDLAAEPGLWHDTAAGLMDSARGEPALRQVMQQLQSEEPPSAGDDLPFLRPADKPGLLGMLGAYEVQEEIGRGGMGVVLKARDLALDRIVALKVLSPYLAGSATARRRFVREGRSAAAVVHDHVVAVHSVSEADGLPYLVMQYVAGESLQARLDRTGPLELAEIVQIGLQTASGLAAAHAQGLVHRDIKPANLLLENGQERVRITDFGLARMADDSGLTQQGVVPGTPDYMAPEQARGEPLDGRADLFSLGCVLYAMCTGEPPFRGSTTLGVLRQVGNEEPASIRALNPDIPAWLETLIRRLLAKVPADRFQSAAEVAALLAGHLACLSQPAPAPSLLEDRAEGAAHEQARTRRRRLRRAVLLGAGLVFVAALASAAFFVAQEQQPGPTERNKDVRGNNPLSTLAVPEPARTLSWPFLALALAVVVAGAVAGALLWVKQFPRRAWLPVLVLPSLLGVGLALWLGWSEGGTEDGDGVFQDFRGSRMPLVPFHLDGPDAAAVTRAEEAGLRITLPADRNQPPWAAVGIVPSFRLGGDFDVIGTYELLSNERPGHGRGVGVALWLATAWVNNTKFAAISRFLLSGAYGGDTYTATWWVDEPNGPNSGSEALPTTARAGQLRLIREGPIVRFLAANQGAGEFREVARANFGADDLVLRFAVNNASPTRVDARLVSLWIRADRMTPIDPPPPGADQATIPVQGHAWKTWVALGLVLTLALGLFLVVRQSRPARKSPAVAASTNGQAKRPAARPICFPCAGCGNPLKAKQALAGKRIKCPSCAKTMLVPQTTDSSARAAPS
jgi:hypothetical protein